MFRCGNFITCASSVARLRRDQRGSVAVIFAIVAIPALGLVAAAVDYARTSSAVTQARAAADAAVLAAGGQSTATQQARQQIASNAAAAYFGAAAANLNLSVVETDVAAGLYQVTVSGNIPTVLSRVLGRSSMEFSVTSRATTNGVTNSKPLEMALALDNTGSMSANMADLKAAANTLVDTVMGAGGGAARVSVVPYVATVNPGLTDAASIANYIDTTAQNPFNGVWQRGAWITWGAGNGCNWNPDTHSRWPYWPPSGGGGGGGAGSGGTGDARDILDILKPIRHLAQELFGVSAAYAADVTPNTVPPFSTSTWKSPTSGVVYQVPAGFQTAAKDVWGAYSTGGCDWLANPATVSQYELFNRVVDQNGQKVAWKGCVEARLSRSEQGWLNSNWGAGLAAANDYDISEDAPTTSDPASLYVPYFAPDEPDYSPFTWGAVAPGAYSASTQGFHNNYLSDGVIPPTWGWKALDSNTWWSAGKFILKYDGTTRAAIIQETPDSSGYTYGPNMGCPDPILRLTNSKAAVTAKIAGLKYWQSGGTVISEGLAWAWRTLSPNAPYADGKAYNTTGLQKVIVLMTDGVNELIDNANNSSGYATANISDYSAYGYLGGTRLWNADNVQTYSGFNTLMNNRLLAACTAAKNAGVIIYTVVFNHTGYLTTQQQSDAQTLLQNCASKASNSYVATDSTSLQNAFSAIAVSATSGTLRLVQ